MDGWMNSVSARADVESQSSLKRLLLALRSRIQARSGRGRAVELDALVMPKVV